MLTRRHLAGLLAAAPLAPAFAQAPSTPTAMPIIGTEAIPTANATEVSMNSSRAPIPKPARISVPNFASRWVKMLIVSTPCRGEKQAMAPTFSMSKNMVHWIRNPFNFGTTRARPENRYQPITEMLIV